MYEELIGELRNKHRAYAATGNEKPGQIFLEAVKALEKSNKVYLVIEDAGFYTEGHETEYIDIIDVNGMTHSRVLYAYQDRQTAETALRRFVENEAEEWETDPELKSIQACGSDEYIDGFYLLGSFYYIQEVSVTTL